jgi:hypothetical protein
MTEILGLFPGEVGRCFEFTTHLHLVQRVRTSKTISLIPPHAFMSWTTIALPLPLPYLVTKFECVNRF